MLDLTMKKKLRWIVLLIAGVMVVPNYFCYDNPAALQVSIEEKLNVTFSEYGLLYTIYATPNIFLPIFGGLLIDKIGQRKSLMIFVALVNIGQGIFMMGGK